MSHFLKFVKNSVKHWYLLLLVGIVFIATGIYSFTSPVEAYLTLALFLGFAFLLSGVSEVVFALANRKEIDNWGWTLISALVTLIAGLILVSHPGITMLTIPIIVGFALMFKSISAIGQSIDLKNYNASGWGYMLATGVLGTIFSIFILWHPFVGGLAVTVWIGITFLVIGIFFVFLSLKLRDLKKFPEKISKELKDKFESIKNEIAEAASK